MRLRSRAALAAIGVVPLLALASAGAYAGGNGATTFTDTQQGVVMVVDFVNPCTGDPGVVTAVENQVFHGTLNKNGSHGSWMTGNIEGKATFVPTDPSRVTYTGHFSATFGDQISQGDGVEHSTFNINASGSDGSHLVFHENAKAVLNADGTVTVSFDHLFCG
jgi:hypothetical protein